MARGAFVTALVDEDDDFRICRFDEFYNFLADDEVYGEIILNGSSPDDIDVDRTEMCKHFLKKLGIDSRSDEEWLGAMWELIYSIWTTEDPIIFYKRTKEAIIMKAIVEYMK